MNSLICDAIARRKVIRFFYGGGFRVAEPFCYGIGTSGNELLRVFQIDGHSRSGVSHDWKLFDVDKITAISITEQIFSGSRPGYNPTDPEMTKIYCRF